MKLKLKKGDIVSLLWEDAEAHSGWRDPDQEWSEPMVMSLGRVIKSVKGFIVLAADFAPDGSGDVNRLLRVPRAMVREVKHLQVREESPHNNSCDQPPHSTGI